MCTWFRNKNQSSASFWHWAPICFLSPPVSSTQAQLCLFVTQLSTTVLLCIVYFKVLFFTWVFAFYATLLHLRGTYCTLYFTTFVTAESILLVTFQLNIFHTLTLFSLDTKYKVCLDFECLWCSVPLQFLLITSLWTQITCIFIACRKVQTISTSFP